MKFLRLSPVLFLILISCDAGKKKSNTTPTVLQTTTASNKFAVKGIVQGIDSGWVFIAQEDTSGRMIGNQDSTKIINGKFEFTGEIEKPEFRFLGLQYNKKQKTFGFGFFLDHGVLNLDVNKNSLYESEASGTKAQDEYNHFKKNYYSLLEVSNQAWFENRKAEQHNDQRKADSLKKVLSDYNHSMRKIVIDQAKQNPASIVSAYIVKQYLLSDPDPEILQSLYSGFDSSVRNTWLGRQIAKAIQAGHRTLIGQPAPAFTLKDQTGNKVSLESFKGKITLVDFWASWCGPCRAENPNLVKAYDQFKPKGFDIVSISLDDNRRAWIDAVAKDKLPWMQLSDLKGSRSEVKELYGIKVIPMNYLLDKEGKIIAKNLRGNGLQEKLREVMK